jgi:hypothetical protein
VRNTGVVSDLTPTGNVMSDPKLLSQIDAYLQAARARAEAINKFAALTKTVKTVYDELSQALTELKAPVPTGKHPREQMVDHSFPTEAYINEAWKTLVAATIRAREAWELIPGDSRTGLSPP